MVRKESTYRVVYKINGKKRSAIVSANDAESAAHRIKSGARVTSVAKFDRNSKYTLDARKLLMPDRDGLIGRENFLTKKWKFDNKEKMKDEER